MVCIEPWRFVQASVERSSYLTDRTSCSNRNDFNGSGFRHLLHRSRLTPCRSAFCPPHNRNATADILSRVPPMNWRGISVSMTTTTSGSPPSGVTAIA
ncbi:transposase for ISThsp9 transposon of the Tn3 family protein [Burkholderia pseudomallei MSHR4378]|nr:transposase for ISThsp9 transposon of the Tn3 family protein [Burkholderia pseudomallei MSHR4378]